LGCGGGIYNCNGTIKNNIITQNTAINYGGGLSLCGGTIQENTITFNVVNGKYGNGHSYGGGLYDCDGNVTDNTISNNCCTGDDQRGGGLYHCDGIITRNKISYNYCPGINEHGGGLSHCDATIKNNLIISNSADYGGGCDYCNGVIENNTFYNNSSIKGGGLRYCYGTIKSNIIIGNSAQINGGGIDHCTAMILNNTIVYNSAADEGGGLKNCSGTIENCIIWKNTSSSYPQISLYCSTPNYCCIQDWVGGGVGNIIDDPLFVDVAGGDYHLRNESPCRDAGTTEVVTWDEVDIDGEPRWWGLKPDMGADEYVDEWGFRFETPEPAWTFQTLPGFFAEPVGEWTTGSLMVHIVEDLNQYGYWTSDGVDEVPLLGGSVYQTTWRIRTDVTEPDAMPMVRLRMNTDDFSWSGNLVLMSTSDGSLMPVPEGRDYTLLIEPDVYDESASEIYYYDHRHMLLNFDVGKFDVNDVLTGTLMLDEVVVERYQSDELSTDTVVALYEFPTDAAGWTAGGAPGRFTLPDAAVTTQGLMLRAQDNTNTFGWWSGPKEVSLIPGALYRMSCEITTDEPKRIATPQVRLRVNLANEQLVVCEHGISVADSSCSPTPGGVLYSVFFTLPSWATSPETIYPSMDILNFDPWDTPTAALYLKSLRIEKMK
jgi:hypothetical protein